MDLQKFKFKTKFRLKKVPTFFKLKRYEFLEKRQTDSTDRHYYYMQCQLLRDLLNTGAETEYLSVHGLLPEAEPEEDDYAEEAYPADDEVRRMFFLGQIRPISLGNKSYIATEVTEYEDRTCISLQISGDEDLRSETICTAHEAGRVFDHFTLDGMDWRWDREDCALRPSPLHYTPAEVKAIREGVQLWDEEILWVDKALAEEALSPLCLEYAFHIGSDGCRWCIADGAALTALWELRIPSGNAQEELSYRCPRYRNTKEEHRAP